MPRESRLSGVLCWMLICAVLVAVSLVFTNYGHERATCAERCSSSFTFSYGLTRQECACLTRTTKAP